MILSDLKAGTIKKKKKDVKTYDCVTSVWGLTFNLNKEVVLRI